VAYKTIIDSINSARPYLGYLIPTIGPNFEPAVSAANYTGQLMCAAPLSWPWNRDEKQITLTTTAQDYVETGWNDFSYLEKASVSPAGIITNVAGSGTVATITANISTQQFQVGSQVTITGLTTTVFNGTWTLTGVTSTTFTFASTHSVSTTPDTGLATTGVIFAISDIKNDDPLSKSSEVGRPDSVAVQDYDGQGDITLRFNIVPDQTYQATLTYQMLPPVLAPTAFVVTAVTFSTPTVTLAGTFTGGASNAFAGYTFVINGCTEASNNGAFVCITSTAIALTFTNINGVTNASEPTGTTATALVPAGASWSPIPNDYAYIYNALFLSFLFETKDEVQKSQTWRLRGVTSMLSKQGGLSQKEKEMFMQAHLGLDLYQQYQTMSNQQSVQARGQ